MYNTWEELKSACENCHRCELCETRTNVVVGVGNENAEVMFIGEGPGENEDLQGEPFVGRAGKLLDKMLMMAMLHPAAILRDPRRKPDAFDDFLKLRDKINEVCNHTYE